jgi:hypothetical protein
LTLRISLYQINYLLGKSEVENENSVALLLVSNSEIVWLYISMDDSPLMDVLDSLQHLQSAH